MLQDYHDDDSGRTPRYYQINAINAVVEAIAGSRKRILLVMATGTGKIYTAFQRRCCADFETMNSHPQY